MKYLKEKKIQIYKNNINTQEIDKFNTLAPEWWNTTAAFKTLHQINPIRLNYILTHSNGLFNKRVLDIGCGGGILSESMAQQGAEVTGLDTSAKSLEIAKEHAFKKKLKINYLQETIEKHAQHYINYYDIITCMEILEHVPNPCSIIQACANTIKINGSVFFSTLNRTFKSWLLAIIGAEYILHIIPKGSHNYNKFITPSELLHWIDSTTLEEQHITGLYYNPWTNKQCLTHNLDINYIIHAQRKK